MHRELLKLTALYAIGVVGVLYAMWALLAVALPEANLNVVKALANSFGIMLSDDIFDKAGTGFRAGSVIMIVFFMSVVLVILNVLFCALTTTLFIRPRVKLITSPFGVLSEAWNASMPYVLVRLSNFHGGVLTNVRLSVVLNVHETRDNGEEFVSALPVDHFTPQRILVMQPKMPWTIAVPGDATLSSSLTRNYHFKPGEPILKSFSPAKKISRVERTLDILIEGSDSKSYSDFVIHRRVPVDTQDGEEYILHLHKGAFKSLPLHIDDPRLLEECVD